MRRLPHLLLPALLLVSALVPAFAVRAQVISPAEPQGPPATGPAVDAGRFTVSVAGRTVGTENFSIQNAGDTLIATARVFQFHPEGDRTDTLFKTVRFVVDAFDFGLHSYNSVQRFRGRTVVRGITIADTTYTSYRQVGGRGSGNTFLLPPGRVFVLDPPVFINFNVVCLNLKNRVFQTRPVTMLVMTPDQDTVITATAKDVGRETIRWAGRPVVARHLTLGDSNVTYDVWMNSEGRLLRLEHLPTHLRVERQGPAVRRRAPRRANG